jgi:tetratricopeptide (TPR) repeat protein/predicted Ser/Thr protein kinase
MDPDAIALFRELADRSPAEREEYCARHQVSAALRAEVESLLRFDSDTVDSLHDYVASAAERLLLANDVGVAGSGALPRIETGGGRCGPYRLLDIIGRGGMGAVYLAERADGEVHHRVAVKLLPSGAGDPQRERFLQERQILATLTHPNIARLLDAGHVEHGQPFLAMEYVDGKPIDVFAAGLSVRQKIALFLKVCAAVAHLHRHLIVHRDLKPSNIFVTADGEPKLLDFGIAKLLDVATDTTVTGMRMLTPDYASPEQVRGGKLSTATDIYSLGAVLYLLLTSKRAHEFDSPSPEGIASVVTARDITRPSKWAPELRGDLEAILLKALRKDPEERYETVEHFAEDLEAFLDSRPVRARSGNGWYRARKFLRRYRVPVAAAAVVIASLAAGLYIANRERAIAQRRFADVRELANKLFDIDAQVRQLSGSAKARQLIVDTSLEYLRRLTADAQRDPELALEVATAYMSVAEVEGVTTGPNLGQLDEAERDLTIAERLIESVVRSRPANRTALLRAAQIAADRMTLAWQRGQSEKALTFAQKSAEWLDRFQAGDGDRSSAPAILNTYVNVAHQYMMAEQFDQALQLAERGSDLALTFDRPLVRGSILTSVVALVHRYQGDLDGALTAARESVRLLDPGAAETAPAPAMNFVVALAREGWILGEDQAISMGRSEEALAVLQRAFDIADDFVHRDPNDESTRSRLFLAGGPMADILRHSNPGRALDIYDHTLRDMDAVHGEFLQLRAVYVLAGSSYALRALGRPAEARERLDRAFATLKKLELYPSEKIEAGSETDRALRALADHEADTGDVARAIQLYQGLLDGLRASANPETSLPSAVDLSHAYQSMAALHARNRRADLASALDSRRLELWRHWDRKLPSNAFVLRQISAQAAP